MRSLYLIRHAKSSWSDGSLSDFDRPLNKRGKRDAPFMAKLLAGKIEQLDLIVSSPANRAKTTADFFREAFSMEQELVKYVPKIYEAAPQTLQTVVQSIPDSVSQVAMFGHNPGFTALANRYSQDYIPNMPTCSIVQIVGVVDSWVDFNPDNATARAFYFPKQYFS